MRSMVQDLSSTNGTDDQINQIGQEYLELRRLVIVGGDDNLSSSSSLTEDGGVGTNPGSNSGAAAPAAAPAIDGAFVGGQHSTSWLNAIQSVGSSALSSSFLQAGQLVQNYEPLEVLSGNATTVSGPDEAPGAAEDADIKVAANANVVGAFSTTTSPPGEDSKPAAVKRNKDNNGQAAAEGEDDSPTASKKHRHA
jgi:hypothetical protein